MLFLLSAFFLWPPWSDPCLITHSRASRSQCSLCPASDFSPRRSMPVHKLCLPLPPCSGHRFSPAFLGQPVGQKVVGGRAEFWELWNTGSAWEVMCLRVNCMQRRMCFLRYFLSEAAPSKRLAFSWNVAVFLHQKCYKLIAKLCKKKKVLEDWGLATETWRGGETGSSCFGSGAWGRPWWAWTPKHLSSSAWGQSLHIFCFECKNVRRNFLWRSTQGLSFFCVGFLKSLAHRKTLTIQ